MKSSAASADLEVRREAAFVADIGVVAVGRRAFFSVWNTSEPMLHGIAQSSRRRPAGS